MADIGSFAAALRRYPDPATSADPTVSGLVARLQGVALGQPPSDAFRAELRAQLVAVTPRLVAEGISDSPSPAASAGRVGRGTVKAILRHLPLRRPLAVLGTLVVAFALLLTGTVWISSRTLPGDSLYGLKRASENVQLSLTSGTGARGREYLELAKRRAAEVSSLLSRTSALASGTGPQAAGGINDRTAKLVAGTLDDADSSLRSGSRLLTGQAVADKSAAPLATLTDWAPQQISRLTSIMDRIPLGTPLHGRALDSKKLAVRLLDRASQLRADLGCACLAGTQRDDLGPLPCTTPCAPTAPRAPGPGSTPPPTGGPGLPSAPGRSSGSTATTQTPGSVGGGSHPPPTTGSGSSTTPNSGQPAPSSSPAPSTGGSSTPPLLSPTAPITIDSCGLSASLGSLSIGVGTCGLHVHL